MEFNRSEQIALLSFIYVYTKQSETGKDIFDTEDTLKIVDLLKQNSDWSREDSLILINRFKEELL